MNGCIPAKLVRGKSSLPWLVTQDIKSLIGCTHHIKNMETLKKKKKAIQTLRQHIKSKIKGAYELFLDGLLGLNDCDSKCDNKNCSIFLETLDKTGRVLHH